jgi:hypothetical protein
MLSEVTMLYYQKLARSAGVFRAVWHMRHQGFTRGQVRMTLVGVVRAA